MILNRWFGLEQRATLVTGYGPQNDVTLKAVFGNSGRTRAGVDVTEETCFALSAFYAGVKYIAWTRGHLPLNVYQRDKNGDREIADAHPIHELLHTRPNPRMSSMAFREMEVAHVILWGDSISFIERSEMGGIKALWPMHPGQVKVGLSTDGQELRYDITNVQNPPSAKKLLGQDEVLHIPGFGFDGIRGKSVISFAREQLGESLALQEVGSAFFGNGAFPGIVLKHPGRLKNAEGLRQSWQKVHGGAGQAAKVAILEEGMDMAVINMPLKDYQWLEGKTFGIDEIARWLGIRPHKLAELSRATFSNIAEQNIESVQDLLPWFKRFEQEYNWKLFQPKDRKKYYTEHVVEGLLQANPEQQANAFASALQNGYMSRNEVRRLKNLNAMGEGGDDFTVQSNLIPIDRLGNLADKQSANPQPPAAPEMNGGDVPGMGSEPGNPAGERDNRVDAAKTALRAAISRMIHKESLDVIEAAKYPERFLEWMEGYYQRYSGKFVGGIRSACETCRSLGMEIDYKSLAESHAERSKEALLDLSGKVLPSKLGEKIASEMQNWDEKLPDLLLNQAILEENNATI